VFQQLARRIAESKRARFGHGVAEDVVRDAERALGVPFPTSYRWWLLRYGSGYLGGHELQGLCPTRLSDREPNEVYVGDIVATVLLNRECGTPAHLLELLNHDGDDVYSLDCLRSRDGEAPIVCQPAGSAGYDDAAPSFDAFLLSQL
jgi:hypothetical protein